MSFFYDLNKKLNGIRADDKQINEDVAKAAAEVKSPARVSLEESLAGDLKSLMEGQVNEISKDTKDSYAKKAKTELDIYNRNKNNPAQSAKGKEVAAKSAANREKGLSRVSEEVADKDYDGDGKKESPKAEVMGSRMKAAAKAGNLKKEDATGGASQSNTLEAKGKTKSYSAKNAAAGKDIGKPGKNFAKIEKSAGGGEKGKKIAGAVLAKLRAAKESVKEADHEMSADKIEAASKKDFKGIKKAVIKHRHGKELDEAGLPDIVDKTQKMNIAKGKKPSSMRNVVKGLKAFVKGNQEPLDEADRDWEETEFDQTCDVGDVLKGTALGDVKVLKITARGVSNEPAELIVQTQAGQKKKVSWDQLGGMEEGRDYPHPNTTRDDERVHQRHFEEDDEMIGYLQKKAGSVPYNAGSGKPDAHNGMEFEGEEQDFRDPMSNPTDLDEAVSRKHFQQIADLLQNIPDEAKRKELAMHHAAIFAQQNPRFDIQRFGQACGVDLAECGMWESLKGGQKKLDVDHDGDIGADDLADLRSGEEITDEGFGEMDAWLKSREKEKGTGKFDARKVSTGTVYTRKPETFGSDDDSDDGAPAVKRGRGRPAVARKPERVTKGAWKRKEVDEHGGGIPNPTGKSWQSMKPSNRKWQTMEEGDQEVNEKAEAGKRHFFDKLAPAAKKVAKVVNKMTKGKDKEVDEAKPMKKPAAEQDHGKMIPEVGLTKVNMKGQEVKKKVKETTTAGSVATASAGGSASNGVGQGVYESFDSEVEKLIAESFTVNMSKTITDNGQNQSNINISATDEDADMLKDLLKNAGIDIHGGSSEEECCSGCGCTPCECDSEVEVDPVADGFANMAIVAGPDQAMGMPGEVEFELDEADAPVTQNSPDYPTNQEYSDDALQYSGGLNKPKSTGQTTTPVIASQLKRQMSEADSFLNLYQAFKGTK